MSDKLNINSKKWQKKYGEDRGYGSDESLTMNETGDYSSGSTHRSSSQSLYAKPPGQTRSTRSGGRQPVRRPSTPAPSRPVPPSRKP